MTTRSFRLLSVTRDRFHFNSVECYKPFLLYIDSIDFTDAGVIVTGMRTNGDHYDKYFIRYQDIRKINYSRKNKIRVSAALEREYRMRDIYAAIADERVDDILKVINKRIEVLEQRNPESFIYE